ncbi:hypothetical protein PybrP1_005129 [[Pythium] brassicae (nom. inval.)]|nr:hypothetical protein PybrP1_005129 [[Pythium] brassicae (nom. inval.)]
MVNNESYDPALLVRVEAVDVALALRRRRAQLEAQLAAVKRRVHVRERFLAEILQPVHDALLQVRDVLLERALVHDGAAHALRDLDRGRLRKVALRRALRHGLDRAHAAVLLEPHAVLEKRLDDVARAANAAVRDHRHAELAREPRRVVHCGRLRAADRAHLLRRADRADAHADLESVRARVDEALALRHGHDVAADHVDVRVRRLDPLNELDLERRVALRRVDHDHVHARCDERSAPFAVARARADRGTDQQLLVRVLGRVREVAVLDEVPARDERDELAARVHDRELALLAFAQNPVRGHDGAQLRRAVLDKVNVAVAHDADNDRADLAVLGDRDAREAELGLDAVHVRERVVRREALGVRDEAVLELLDEPHLLRLLRHRHVVVDDADAPV